MRKRSRSVAATIQTLGGTYYRIHPSPTWIFLQNYTNSSPGVSQEPYLSREVCWDDLHKGPPYTTGGPFEKWDSAAGFSQPTPYRIYTGTLGSYRYEYRGGFCCSVVPVNSWFGQTSKWSDKPVLVSAPFTDSWGDFSSYGSKAWNKYKPGQQIADMAVFIGELTDVPRMLKTTASWFSREYISRFGRNPKRAAKQAADNWLNTQFGWLPFLSDLRKFYRAWKTSDEWYQNLVRNNGQWVKRGGTVTKDETEEVIMSTGDTAGNFLHPALTSAYYPAYPSMGGAKILRVTQQRAWFEARFKYYVPEIRSVQWKRKAIRHLYGLEVSPAVLWELLPWSWLVDWFSNIGEQLQASSTGLFANLTAKYAYLMGTKTVEVRCESTPKLNPPERFVWYLRLQRKGRTEANPFGFSASWGSLTPRQWSILGALGISRMH